MVLRQYYRPTNPFLSRNVASEPDVVCAGDRSSQFSLGRADRARVCSGLASWGSHTWIEFPGFQKGPMIPVNAL